MKYRLTLPIALGLALVVTAPAPRLHAQTAPPPQDQDHAAHHPDAVPAAAPPATGMAGQGMAGPGMQGMMSMTMMSGMGGGMGPMASMAALPLMRGLDHVDGRLAFLKAELRIVDTQEPLWRRFADAVHAAAAPVSKGAAMAPGATAPARLGLVEGALATRLDAARMIRAAFGPLYDALSDDQKKTADELVGPMVMF